MKNLISTALTIVVFTISSHCQNPSANDSSKDLDIQQNTYRKHAIGSTLAMAGNFLPDPPSFFQLNYGYLLTQKDAIIVEAITWKYGFPLGIPYGPSFDSPDEEYPGKIRGYGIGVGYQRFHWKKLYTTVQATPFLQKFLNEEGEKIQNGFQLFLQFRLGYRIEFFNHRFYFEPSIACNYWPINTNFPDEFAALEDRWPNYFLFEPGLHFGFKF